MYADHRSIQPYEGRKDIQQHILMTDKRGPMKDEWGNKN